MTSPIGWQLAMAWNCLGEAVRIMHTAGKSPAREWGDTRPRGSRARFGGAGMKRALDNMNTTTGELFPPEPLTSERRDKAS